MASQKLVCDVFLFCMASIYMFAFTSLYLQLPGLYGDSGLLPARNVLKTDDKSQSKYHHFLKLPTLLWFASDVGLTTETAMDFLCLLGSLLSFMAIVTQACRTFATFLSLWFLYFSLYQVGQTFLWFQWDILLLEAGFLCLFVVSVRRPSCQSSLPHESISLWLVKWLLFRLMFASGVVKLTSGCPTWWGLTALNWHYESQCIPTPLAWYAHQLPDWFQKLSVVMTFVIEGPVPFLFFAPIRSLRIFAFYLQVMFQILIILTGNYNFFNLLTMALCLSLLDDLYLTSLFPWLKTEQGNGTTTPKISWIQRSLKCLKTFVFGFVMFTLFYWTKRLFLLRMDSAISVHSKIDFTSTQFYDGLRKAVQVSIWIGALSLIVEIVFCFIKCVRQPSITTKMSFVVQWFVLACAAVWAFSISVVPYTSIDQASNQNIWPVIRKWYQHVDHYQIANSYGLFRRMTGVGGRPELVIEGSDSIDGPWKAYNFLYKPGSLKRSPPFIVPHQPRLDWQMWFAALGTYHNNPWFVHLLQKLLHGEKVVLDLLAQKQPFRKPPQYIRAHLYTYHYTKVYKNITSFGDFIHNTKLIKSWWKREFTSEYLPPLSKSEPTLQTYLSHFQLGTNFGQAKKQRGFLQAGLNYLRQKIGRIDPFIFLLCLFALGVLLNLLLGSRYHKPNGYPSGAGCSKLG